MRRLLICSGVLGGGTVLVFGAAALTAVLVPPSQIVPQGQVFPPDRFMAAPLMPLAIDQAPGVILDSTGINGDTVVALPANQEIP
jgi:hypothetical protein